MSHLPVGSPPHPWLCLQSLRANDRWIKIKCQVVAYVQSGDPTNQAWDDWPLRMTFRINSFLRANGPAPEPDLAILGFLDD